MGIANIINNSTTTSGGEIVRELVNSSDGAGLHFEAGGNIELTNSAAAEFGTSDFSVEFVLNQTGDNTNDNVIYYSHQTGNNRFYAFNDISQNTFDLGFVNSFGTLYVKELEYDMSADYGTPTHYVVTCDRDGNATLYKNGNSVATVDISDQASVEIGASNTTSGYIGSWVSTYGVLGTFYRFRTWNKALTSAEVQTAYERADVDYADQYGSQTELVTNGDFASATGWSVQSVAIGSNVSTWTDDGSTLQFIRQNAWTITKGKKYRLQFTVSSFSGAGSIGLFDYARANRIADNISVSGNGTVTAEFTAQNSSSSGALLGTADAANNIAAVIDDLSCVQIGCVSDYDLAFANPTQSLTVQDRSGAADGTCSASGVTQVQPVVQLNSTSARIGTSAATPADGQVIANSGKIQNSAWPVFEVELSGGSASAAQVKVTADDGDKAVLEVAGSTSSISGLSQGDAVLYATNNLQFGTNNSRTAKLAIDSTGNVTINGGADSITKVVGTTTGARLDLQTNSHHRFMQVVESDGKFRIYDQTADAERFAISSTGLATFNNGIAFSQTNTSATGATATGTTLNHYEEGTWTPTTGGDSTYTVQTGRYTRVGRLVTATFDVTVNTRTNQSYLVAGLPFSAASGENIGAGGSITYYSGLAVSPVNFSPTVAGSTVHIRSATSAATSPSNHGLIEAGSRIAGIVTYTV